MFQRFIGFSLAGEKGQLPLRLGKPHPHRSSKLIAVPLPSYLREELEKWSTGALKLACCDLNKANKFDSIFEIISECLSDCIAFTAN